MMPALLTRMYLVFLGNVADVALRVDALGLIVGQRLVQMVLRTAVEGDFRASLGVSLCYGETYPVSGSRDESHLAFKGEIL